MAKKSGDMAVLVARSVLILLLDQLILPDVYHLISKSEYLNTEINCLVVM